MPDTTISCKDVVLDVVGRRQSSEEVIGGVVSVAMCCISPERRTLLRVATTRLLVAENQQHEVHEIELVIGNRPGVEEVGISRICNSCYLD